MLNPHPNDADESGLAIGWISTAELFLLLVVVLLSCLLLVQNKLKAAEGKAATSATERDRRREMEVSFLSARREADGLRAEMLTLRARLEASLAAEARAGWLLGGVIADRDRFVRADAAGRLEVLRRRQAAAEALAAKIQAEAERDDARDAARRAQQKVKDAQAAADAAKKALEDANAALKRAQADARAARGKTDELTATLDRAKLASENRFEGLRLAGERVVLLVDRSGSMRYVDPDTPAPQKWAIVCATVGRILRSLPDLKEFQVITLDDVASYPMGSKGEWLPYDPERSPDAAARALLAAKPERGNTNLYAGLEAAFGFADRGLSAVYFLSDGLPNVGPPLPDEDYRAVEAARRAGGDKRAESLTGEKLGAQVRRAVREKWNRGKKVRIEAVGFYYETPELGSFLWALARENGGNFIGMSKP